MLLPAFYPIVDSLACRRLGCEPLAEAKRLVDAGAAIVQFRHKGDVSRAVFDVAAAIGEVCRGSGVAYIVNDRCDVALAVGADGVHLGQEDLPPRAVRSIVPDGFVVGFSTHREAQLDAGLMEPVDYLALGPVFATGSKERPDPLVGVAELARLRQRCGRPLVAIGGINLATANEVLAAGVDSVAVISGWMGASPADLARWVALTRSVA